MVWDGTRPSLVASACSWRPSGRAKMKVVAESAGTGARANDAMHGVCVGHKLVVPLHLPEEVESSSNELLNVGGDLLTVELLVEAPCARWRRGAWDEAATAGEWDGIVGKVVAGSAPVSEGVGEEAGDMGDEAPWSSASTWGGGGGRGGVESAAMWGGLGGHGGGLEVGNGPDW
uniref:Uncharacterized protein n=1 Tax=Oryza glumipatula TaxID=40148 RepID=A0A0D9Y8Y5_9ORYZ